MPNTWLEKTGCIRKSEDDFILDVGRSRIVISRRWDGLDQAYEWTAYCRNGEVAGAGISPQEAVADLMVAIDARVTSLQDLQDGLRNLPRND
jgi:hypothetical protein